MRTGKIARLPRIIRDQLNQRLDDGEPGVQLVEWLNGLPEVQEVLKTHFGERPITEGNLTLWKQGGFRDWQIHQEARDYVQEFIPDSGDPAKAQPSELAAPLTATLLAHYAAALARAGKDEAEDPRDCARRIGKSLHEITSVRRCDHERERVEIQRDRARERTETERQRLALGREWLELEKSKIENQKSKPKTAKAREDGAPDLDSMTREEKSAYIKKIIYGD